jgi:hypothetical protein
LPARISIDEIEVIASSSSIRVDITIIVGSDSSARNVAKSLTLSALNYELNLEGLPAAVMVYIKKCGLGFRVAEMRVPIKGKALPLSTLPCTHQHDRSLTLFPMPCVPHTSRPNPSLPPSSLARWRRPRCIILADMVPTCLQLSVTAVRRCVCVCVCLQILARHAESHLRNTLTNSFFPVRQRVGRALILRPPAPLVNKPPPPFPVVAGIPRPSARTDSHQRDAPTPVCHVDLHQRHARQPQVLPYISLSYIGNCIKYRSPYASRYVSYAGF